MCSAQRPTEGADSLCRTCHGTGALIGGDEYQPCPGCHEKVLCGSCGNLVSMSFTEPLNNGRYEWRRCFTCRWATQLRYEREVTA